MKNVVIVHGSNPKDGQRQDDEDYVPQNVKNWIPWIKKGLEKKGINVYNPLMPESWDPDYEKWKVEFEKLSVDENTILIGHSAGAAFLVHWLGDSLRKIRKLILVAPARIVVDPSYQPKKFYNFKINGTVKNNVKEIVYFVSDDDLPRFIDSAKVYKDKIGGKIIELKGRGHFLVRGNKSPEFPELLEEVLE